MPTPTDRTPEDLVPLSPEEQAVQDGGEVGDAPAPEPEPEPAPAEAAAPAAAGEAPAAAAEAVAPEVPGEAAVPETAEELRRHLLARDEEIRMMRRRMARERQQRQTLEQQMRSSLPAAAPAAATPVPPGVPVELGEDGHYSVNPEALQRAIAATKAAAGPSPQEHAAEMAREYDGWRTEMILEHEDPGLARSVVAELEEAYVWLDGKTLEAVRASGFMPVGTGELIEFLEDEGLAKEFREKFPGADIEELVEAPNSKYKTRRAFARYMDRRGERAASPAAADPAAADSSPTRAQVVAMGSRPRPMGVKGRVAMPASTGQRTSALLAKDVMKMTNEEIAELDTLAQSS